MITQFGSLFAGHVDLDDEGLDGTPANDRWLSDEHLATVFPKSEAIAKLMDRRGYDTFWLAEHHFQREGYECIPNILLLALHLCHITKNIKMFAPLGFMPGLTPEQIDAVADPKRARQARLPTLRNAIKAGTWLVGPPELITEQLMEVQHKYPGLEVVNVGQPVGTPQAVILEQLERFSTQVMPAFQ